MRNRRGFTLVELLVVLAIFALILAVSVPDLANLSLSIEKKQLDSTAEELFLLAQNHLAYIKSAGSKAILDEADFLDGERALFCFSGGLGSSLLPESALPVGNAVVIVDIRTMSAIAVFYSEKLSADELKDFATAEDMSINQSVGYFGGDCDVLTPRDNWLVPTLTVNNGNKLTIDFSCDISDCPKDADFSAQATFFCQNGTYTEEIPALTIEKAPLDIHSSGERMTLRGSVLIDEITTDGGSYYMQNFSSRIGQPDTIAVSVRIYQKIGDTVDVTAELTSQEHAVTFSPLFAEKSGSDIKIGNCRHLNNLRYLADSDKIYITQTADINFDDGLFPYGFEPIGTFSGTFDGADKLIIAPKIKADGESVGIFGKISGYIKNVHIIGTGNSVIFGEVCGSASVGALCAVAETGSVIENCSVSGLSLGVAACDSADVCVGGLVGEARGKITQCSTSCDISVSGADSAKIGGLVGKLIGGTVELSHSAGELSLSENGVNSQAAGITNGSGEVSSCYSECSAGYIGGAEYYGIATPETDFGDCFFISENAWLAAYSSGAVSFDELKSLEIEGFAPADDLCPFPESVTVNGVPTRFGEPQLANPRGLVGIVKVEYSSGEYVNDVLACLDGYGNISARSPSISWNSPQDGAARYYLYRSVCSHPAKGEEMGWDCAFDGAVELGEECSCDGFVYQQILLGDGEISAELRFGSVSRTVTLTGGQTGAKLGKVGVVAAVNHIEFEFMDDMDIMTETYRYYCYFYDFAADIGDFFFDDGFGSGDVSDNDRITFEREIDYDDEVRIYVFANAESEPIIGSHFMLDDMLAPPKMMGGICYREWLGEWHLGEEFSVKADFGGRLLEVPITIEMGWDGLISVEMRDGRVS